MITLIRVLLGAKATLINRWKADHFVYLVLSILIIGIWLPRLRGPIDLRWDGAVYYILGTSIAEGKGYRLLNEPGEIQAIQYPPVLPLVVAVHQWVLGSSDPLIVGPWLRLSSFVIFFGYIVTIYMVLRLYLPVGVAFIGTAICLCHMYTYFMSDLLFPEVLYGLATTSFVLVSQRGYTRTSTVAAALLAISAFGLRTIGITLLVAWVAESLFDKKIKRTALRFLVTLVPILCWQAYIASVVTGSEYNQPVYEYQRATYMFYNVSYANNIFTLKDSFAPELGPASLRDVVTRVLLNVEQVPQSLGAAVSSIRKIYELPWKLYNMPFPFSTSWPVDVALTTLGCLILGGIGLQLKKRQWLLPLYVLLSIAIMCLTPWPGQFNRYLMPLAPFLVLFLLSTLLTITRLAGRWRIVSTIFTGVVVSLILLQQILTMGMTFARSHQNVMYNHQNSGKVDYRLFFYNDVDRALDAGIDWLQEHAKPSEVLAGSAPHWMYLRTRLKAVMAPFEMDPVKAQALLDSVPVTYLLLDEGMEVETKRYMAPVVQQFPERWERVYADIIASEPDQSQGGEFVIYRRVGLPRSRSDASTMHFGE